MNADKKFTVRPEIEVNLTMQDIDDIMVSALEGGITSWCRQAEVVEEKRCADWGHEQIGRGGALILWDRADGAKHELTLEKFLEGFKLWLENNGDKYGAVSGGEVDCGEIDAGCADCIIQYAVFGDVIHG